MASLFPTLLCHKLIKILGKAADPDAKLPEDRDGDDFEHIDVTQSVSGISSTQENRTFSGLPRPHEDYVFGPVIGMSKRVPASDISDPSTVLGKYEFLQKNWTKDTLDAEKGLIYTTASSDTPKSNKTWTAEQVWGFEEIDGVKYFSRHVHFFTPDETVTARMIYDYVGPVPV
ncbi:SubName: Full=Uncharacterized protein {ECO:0000313/EMBL:CCA71139.1} [Serendipita indica DSM 11827]|nr:SubName: Full=Uncharacterized protein {ECO:0000313/EMBL:CCA71139.1} [Serendipita indica DSM 11827]